jgi:hypothetical protein
LDVADFAEEAHHAAKRSNRPRHSVAASASEKWV